MTHRETLDEMIDRVSASMTAVPADEEFGGRLTLPPLASDRVPLSWIAVPAGAAAVAAAIIAIGSSRGPQQLLPLAASPTAPVFVAALPAVAGEGVLVSPAVGEATQSSSPDWPGTVRTIAALPVPLELTVDALPIEALAIGSVELDRLIVPTLAVEGLDRQPDPKENK
jgi:hypothetical protein